MTVTETDQTQEATETGQTLRFRAVDLGRVLHNASLFATRVKLRPVLRNVNLTISQQGNIDAPVSARLTATATDSYILGEDHLDAVTFSAVVRSSYQLPSDDLAPVVKELSRRSSPPRECVVTFSDDRITFAVDAWSQTLKVFTDGDYPYTDTLWPEGAPEPLPIISLQPDRLAKFAKVIPVGGKVRDPKHDRGIRLSFRSPTHPVLIERMETDATFRALLMPVRSS